MNLANDVLPLPWLLAAFLGYVALVAWALSGIDRWRLQRETQRQHLLFASSVAVMVLWLVRTDVMLGLSAHVLGMTALTLLVGWRQAVVGSLFPVVGSVLVGAEPWQTVGLAGLIVAALPIGVTHLLWRISDRLLPSNMAIYLGVCALLGSVLAAALARLAVLGLLLLAGAFTFAAVGKDYLTLLPLTLLPEGVINVIAVSMLAAWRPQWLMTLRQQRYLSR
jgi:uncharacterized membrane protein